ncbi:MATH domain and coiled-coil domain-containing protein At3g58270-like [Abrus precatorius]|uniref:MATH domain and coiled-coil domain-containing protein At3g58270-like n=1 Tax=Abrus precatorius TaxID=3816 RepID=A0A8B8L1E5_ABRPR|nr:MATH domain and coiled-coil domain-containing protein At3g58270-like [Abrus precatorius]
MESQQVKGVVAVEKFTWKVEAFSKLKNKKISSKAFKVGGYRWKIVLYPKGRDVEYLSLYMKVADSLAPYGWSRFASFRLALINHVDTKKSIVKETQQKFNAGNSAWGSSSFIPLSEFHDPTQGYLVNDTCIIEAQVSVSKVAFNIPDNLATIHKPNGDQPGLTEVEIEEQEMTPSDVTSSPTSTHDSKSDNVNEVEEQFVHSEDQEMGPKQVEFIPSAPPMYPSLFNEYEEVILTPLSDLIDFKSLEPEEAYFIPLWEEVCSWHPSLVENQKRRSPRFILWAFIALGRVLHFLKTKTLRDMGKDDCMMHLQTLWEELQPFGFDLIWLEPHVKSALGAKAYLERAECMKNLRVNVASLEMETRKLKAKLAVTELDLEVARKDLEEVENGFEERDMDAELGYGVP